MATSPLPLRSVRSVPFICTRCSLKLRTSAFRQRRIHSSSVRQANETGRAQKTQKSILDVLEERGFINQIAGTRDELDNLLKSKYVGAYVGIDPTASSMHVGHMIPFMALFWMHLHGHRTITLVGGATASVGDPTGRTTERMQQSDVTRLANTDGINTQLTRLWKNVELLAQKNQAELPEKTQRHGEIQNNDTWLQNTSIMEVLSTIGRGLRLGPMLSRDTVKNKMQKFEGMSFSEFCYPVLQAWDWWHMYRKKQVQLQIGGADQYGNILSGIDAIKSASRGVEKKELRPLDPSHPLSVPMGFTVPLLTTSSGEKFGKSAGNAVWLDAKQTSVFDLYGFFVSQPDSDVERLLKYFTFLPTPQIKDTMAKHLVAPERRVAQHLLAREFVELVHGPEEAAMAEQQHRDLFSRKDMLENVDEAFENPDVTLPRSLVTNKPFPVILWSAGLTASKSEATRLVKNNGAYVMSWHKSERSTRSKGSAAEAFEQISDTGSCPKTHHFLKGTDDVASGLILRSGKRKMRVVKLVSDEQFENLGLDAPGWRESRQL